MSKPVWLRDENGDLYIGVQRRAADSSCHGTGREPERPFKTTPAVSFKASRLQFAHDVKCPQCQRVLRVFIDVRDGTKTFDVVSHEDPLCSPTIFDSIEELRQRDDNFDESVWKQVDETWAR